jgi:hypothetical protein
MHKFKCMEDTMKLLRICIVLSMLFNKSDCKWRTYANRPINDNTRTVNMTKDALAAANTSDIVLYFGGIDSSIEGEAWDRYSIAGSLAQLDLISQGLSLALHHHQNGRSTRRHSPLPNPQHFRHPTGGASRPRRRARSLRHPGPGSRAS